MKSQFLLVLLSYATLVECIIPLNVLLSIINQFKLLDIKIQKNCFTITEKIEFIKIFSNLGKMSHLNEKTFHQSHSFIRCTENIKNIISDKSITSTTVVISQIEKENSLNFVNISIGENVYFFDKNTFKIYEAYEINKVHITRCLGQFTTNKSKNEIVKFSPAFDFADSFVDRRRDFHGIQLIGMTEQWASDIIIPDDFVDKSYYFPENETYDVTNIVSGSYINVLHQLEMYFNFSTKLYKRKDGIWGLPKTMANGTIQLDGMMKSITEGHVDFICVSYGMLLSRLSYLDFLVPMSQIHMSLFIANSNKFDIIDWTVYLTPFSIKIWLIIVASAITFMFIITIMERQYNEEIVSYNFKKIYTNYVSN